HFMSMIVVEPSDGGETAHLVIEICADGHPKDALERLSNTVPKLLLKVLRKAGIKVAPENLASYLEEHRCEFGMGLHQKAGLAFCGTPEMSVPRILAEAGLAAEIRRRLYNKPKNIAPGPALPKLQRVRARIFQNADLKWAFVSEPVPLLG